MIERQDGGIAEASQSFGLKIWRNAAHLLTVGAPHGGAPAAGSGGRECQAPLSGKWRRP